MNATTTPPDDAGASAFSDLATGLLSGSDPLSVERRLGRIAHIDDDPDIRDTVKRILRASGYDVDSYQTMRDFTASLWNSPKPPDLAILDVMVETMDIGLEAYVDIRKRFPALHMIFMTSLGEEIRPYFTNLSDEWILIVEKPVEPASLLSIIRSRLEAEAADSEAGELAIA